MVINGNNNGLIISFKSWRNLKTEFSGVAEGVVLTVEFTVIWHTIVIISSLSWE